MHHAFFSASLAQLGRAGPPVIWNVRHSLHDLQREKPLTRAVLRACAGMSGAPAAIAFNAAASKAQYRAFGFRNDRMIVIENGFDTGRFRPRPEARALLEKNFGVSPDDLVIASIARPHPMKDPFTLIDAVGRLRRRGFAARLLLAGEGYDDPPADIRAALDAAFPPGTAILSGHRADIADWLSGVDIFALSSAWGEGFPNVLGEALASGVPCVATDVGDSAAIVGEGGRIAPPGDPAAFSDALADLARLDREGRRRLGAAGRDRVIRHYAIDRIVERYSDLYREVLLDAAAAGAADGAAGAASGRC
jgi:glycosyltransferase involved in cell wall biosynthesis